MKKKITFLSFLFLFTLFTTLSYSQTLNFDGNGWANAQNLTSSFSDTGFTFSYESSPGSGTNMLANTVAQGGGDAGFACGAFVATDVLTISSNDGSEFDFQSFYAFNAFTGTMRIRGFKDGSLVATETGFTVTSLATNNVSSVNSDFQDVDTVIFDTGSGGFGLAAGYDDFVFGAAAAGDSTAPVFENSTPSSSSVAQTGFTLGTDIDEAGTIYYVVVANGASAPSAAEVKAGTGNGGSGQITSGNAAVSTGGFTNDFSVTGLTAATAYDVYVVAEDDEGTPNLQASATKIDVTTASLIALTVTGLTGDNKVYSGTTAGSASGVASLSGVVGGDDVSLGGSPVYTFANANVGTGITITTTGFTISGTDSGKYSLTQPTLSANITAATLTVTGLTGDNKVYSGTTAGTASGVASLSGVIGADDVSLGGSPVYTFANANVGTGITITSTGFTISGTDSGNYSLTQPTLSADITAATLTVVGLTGDDKVYSGTTAGTASGTATLSGIIGADDVSLGGSPVYTFASANVGTGITITTTGFTISGTESGNYTLTQPTLSADITAATLTVVGLTGDDKVYSGTTAGTASGTATLSGIIGADDVSLGGSPVYTFASANVGTGITITTTGFTISGTDSGNYSLTQPTLSADITAATLTVVGLTGDDKVHDGTTAATASGTATLSGVIGADDVSLGGSPVYTFASASIGTGITITTTGFTISGTDSGNYSLTQPTLSADITGISLTITGLTGDDKVYDGTTAGTASGVASLSGVIGGDDVSLSGSPVYTFASSNVGTGITITTTGFTLSGADAGKYSLTQPTLSANITAATLTVVGLTGDDKVYDGTTAGTASGVATLSGVIGADDVSLGGSPVYTFANANVGTGITVTSSGFTTSGTDSGNYTLTHPTLSADITAATLTVVGLTGDDKVYDGTTAATASGTATLSGVIGADDVSLGGSPVYTFANANVGTGITINTTGFTISGTDSGNYSLTQPTLSADITAATLTVVGLTGDNKVYDGTTAATASGTATLSGVIGADDVSLGGSPVYTFANANVGTGITINTTGFTTSGTDSGNYSLTQPTLSADITAATLTVVGLTGDNKVYDGTTAATASGTATLSGIIGADDVSLGGSPVYTFANANVGTGITVTSTGFTISGTDSGNYSLTQPTLSADITAATLTVVGLTGDDKVYDGTTAATASGTATLSGIIGADDVSLDGSPVYTFANANVGTGITITTTGFTISGTESGNYSLTQPTLSADITAATLTVVGLTGDNKVYDGTTAATASGTATLSGIIGADDVSLGGSPVYTFANANVGTGITINTTGFTTSGTDSGNYTLTQPTLSADITAATLTVVGLTGDNKVYDGTTAATASGTGTLSGIIGADDVSLSGSPVFTFANANVGTGITINTSGVTLSGTDSGNYSLTQPTLSADITAATLTVVGLTGDNKVYDGTTAATASGTATLSGIIGADDVSLGGSPVYTFANANVGTGITITTTGFTISGTESGNYSLTQPTLSADITAATLTVVGLTGDNKVYDGTTAATASGTATLSGVIGADDVTLGGSPVYTFASADVGTGITINTTGFTTSGTDSGNYTLTQPTLSGDITAPILSFAATSSNADESVSSTNLAVNLSTAYTANVTVDYTVTGTATGGGTDHTLANGTLTINTGDSSDNITISGIVDDAILEANETVIVTLSNPTNAVLGVNTVHTYTINNNDSATVAFDFNVSANEDNGAQTFTVTVDNAVDGGFTVDVNTVDGTATVADGDYTAVTGQTLTFVGTAGESQSFTVTPTTDNKVEADENLTISMSNLAGTTFSTTQINITSIGNYIIQNDDSAILTIEDVEVVEADGVANITATLSNPVQGGFDLNITTVNGTAVATSDYTALADQLGATFTGNAGETQVLSIDITDDMVGEEIEDFTVTLSSLGSTTLGSSIDITDTATVTITDDDAPVVTMVSVPTDGLYGIGDNLDFTVTFTNPANITGTPSIPVTIGTTTVQATLNGTFTNSLTADFRYTVVEGDLDTDGIAVGAAINLNGGTILGNTNIPAILDLSNVASTANVDVDGVRPIPTITSTVPDPTNAAFDVTITFSEAVTGFEITDLDLGNATASNFAGSGSVYTATITPIVDGGVIVFVPENVAVDAAGNGNDISDEFFVDYDATNPTVTMTTTAPDPTNMPFTLDIVFDEPVTGFDISDLTVTNGTASDFVAISTTVYSATITPTVTGTVTIDIAAGAAQDAATNGNDAATFSIEYDETPPLPPTITHISDYTCEGDVSTTGDNTLEISGTAEENSIIEVFIEGISIGTTVTEATGFFTFDHTGTTLADGTYNFTVTATDSADNTSPISTPLTITIDSTDTDGDGIPDICDEDDDGNGVTDTEEDCDGDGIVDHLDTDNSGCSSAITQTRQYGFSPNGDGVNDGWYIENITAYPNSVVQVYSRSGKLVFKKKGYQNDWEGVSNQISNSGSENRLPVGPYIFIIDLGDGSRPTRGWLYINY